MPGQIHLADRVLVELDLLFQPRVAVGERLLLQRDLDQVGAVAVDDLGLEMGEGHGGFDGAPVDQVLIRVGQRRASHGEIGDGFQQARLPLRVRAQQQNGRGREIEFQPVVGAKLA